MKDSGMNSAFMSADPAFAPVFSHVYVEESVLETDAVSRILHRLPQPHVIPIRHYKDVFNRRGQNPTLQRRSPSLILARKTGTLLYSGAPVCQDFGFQHFYYTSLCMNCLYDCDYCFLKGMYPTGNLVLSVNLTDYFAAIEQLLGAHPVYLSVSYDTDLCALEGLTGFVAAFRAFLDTHAGLTIELRTKSACVNLLQSLPPSDRLIFAFTLSPESIAREHEHRAPGLQERLKAVKTSLAYGHPTRLCFDPMLFVPDWQARYRQMAVSVTDALGKDGFGQLRDLSVGSFRIARDYLKTLRKNAPDSPIVQYPFEWMDSYACYPSELRERMETFLVHCLAPCMPSERIFRWEENMP